LDAVVRQRYLTVQAKTRQARTGKNAGTNRTTGFVNRKVGDSIEQNPAEGISAEPMEILLIANSVEPVQGRIHINEPFLFRDGGNPTEYGVRLNSR
jgi:hypothetical protein